MPGGKPEGDEKGIESLAREIEEEHSCKLIRDSVEFFGDFEDIATNEPDKTISMKVFTGRIKGEPEPSSEIVEQKWFGRGDDTGVLSPIIRNKILPALKQSGLI